MTATLKQVLEEALKEAVVLRQHGHTVQRRPSAGAGLGGSMSGMPGDFSWWEPENLFREDGMSLSHNLEDALLTVAVNRNVDPANTALVSACYELEGLGYIDLREMHESQTHERQLYKMTVLHITPEGVEELDAIKARRGI